MPNGRPKSPHKRIAKAVNDKNIEELLWAYIDLHAYELRKGDEITFSGNQMTAILSELIKHTKELSDGGNGNMTEIETFFKNNKKKAI
jgi:hypothetical protein